MLRVELIGLQIRSLYELIASVMHPNLEERMTLSEKIQIVAKTLFAGALTTVLSVIGTAIALPDSNIYIFCFTTGMAFGTLTALGFMWFLVVMLVEIGKEQDISQEYMFVDDKYKIVERDLKRTKRIGLQLSDAYNQVELLQFDSLKPEIWRELIEGGN